MSKVISILREIDGDRVRVSVSPADKVAKTLGDVSSYWKLQGPHVLELNGKDLSPHFVWSDISIDSSDVLILKPANTLRSLPEDLWKERASNEVEYLRNKGCTVSVESSEKEFRLDVELKEVPGPILIGDMVATSFNHRFLISLSRSYPYVPPRLEWKSPIYHPNIAPPKRGGDVSCRYLSNWIFSHGLPKLLEHLIQLLEEPQMEKVLDHKECVEASQKNKDIGKNS
ncbi:MAG: ubiquitin-conjugating enzyme E2 [Thermoplasmata archaeon]